MLQFQILLFNIWYWILGSYYGMKSFRPDYPYDDNHKHVSEDLIEVCTIGFLSIFFNILHLFLELFFIIAMPSKHVSSFHPNLSEH